MAVAVGVDVDSVGGAGTLAVEQNAERNRFTLPRSSQHEVDVACLEAEDDPPAGRVQADALSLRRPVAGERPLVEPQAVG